jgi:translation initiation factor IF-2
MVVPAPAELKGPRVVRIEAPEQDQRSRPRPGGMDRGPRPMGPGGPRLPIGPEAPGSDRPGAGGFRKPPGKKGDEAVPARSRSPRRHGDASEVSERMKEWRDRDVQERRERLASASGHGLKAWRSAEQRRSKSHSGPSTAPRKGEVEIVTPILVKDFCNAVGITFAVISKKLMESGKLLRISDMVDLETAETIALELGITLKVVAAKSPLEKLQHRHENLERVNLQPRPPVVAMLGHVDHGKTSLLDAIRQANVASGEAGGITQHIGAYRVDRGDWHVTFIDTPGHEAFTSMRARGAHLTDVVVLVVAADDGVMPQTIEAMNHAKAAGVQIVVALNKIDLPGVDLNKIYGQLAEHDLTPSEWGGTTDVIKTSATKKTGVDELLAHLSTLSELLDLKADPSIDARATVIEARMKEGRGVVAQVLVREGTLKPGQVIVCGPAAGKVRALIDDRGRPVREAGPGTPVEVLGLDELPSTGDTLFQADDLTEAKEIAEDIRRTRREEALSALTVRKARGLEDLLKTAGADEIPELSIILKVDVEGSVEAIQGQLKGIPAEKAKLRILHCAVGAISEADVALAQASGAIVFGFNVVPESGAERLADQVGVQIRQYRVIYEMIDDVRKAMEGLLEPERREESRGKAEVREVFNITRVGTIAGCIVKDGLIQRSCKVRLVRDGRVILEGNGLDSLKRFKDDAKEVRAGLECGIKIAGFDDVKPGDVIEAYEVVEVAQKLR